MDDQDTDNLQQQEYRSNGIKSHSECLSSSSSNDDVITPLHACLEFVNGSNIVTHLAVCIYDMERSDGTLVSADFPRYVIWIPIATNSNLRSVYATYYPGSGSGGLTSLPVESLPPDSQTFTLAIYPTANLLKEEAAKDKYPKQDMTPQQAEEMPAQQVNFLFSTHPDYKDEHVTEGLADPSKSDVEADAEPKEADTA